MSSKKKKASKPKDKYYKFRKIDDINSLPEMLVWIWKEDLVSVKMFIDAYGYDGMARFSRAFMGGKDPYVKVVGDVSGESMRLTQKGIETVMQIENNKTQNNISRATATTTMYLAVFAGLAFTLQVFNTEMSILSKALLSLTTFVIIGYLLLHNK